MKKTILNLAVSGFVAVAMLTSCKSPSEKVAIAKAKETEAKENVAAAKSTLTKSLEDSLVVAKSDSVNLWEKFKKESEMKINDNKKRIADLKISITGKTEDAKAGYQKTINELEQKNENLKTRLADYKDDRNNDMKTFKQKFNNDMNDITRSIKNIKIK